MTRDRGRLPPYEETWPPPSPPPYYGNGVLGELRERVRELETMLPLLKEMAIDRFSTQAKRIDGVEARLKSGDSRMDGIETRLTAAEQAAAPVPALTARVDAIERRWAGWKAGLQYAVSAVLFALVFAGKVTWAEAINLLRLFMPGADMLPLLGHKAFCKFRSDILGVEPTGPIRAPDVCLCPVKHWRIEAAQPQENIWLIHPLSNNVRTTLRAKAAELAWR